MHTPNTDFLTVLRNCENHKFVVHVKLLKKKSKKTTNFVDFVKKQKIKI